MNVVKNASFKKQHRLKERLEKFSNALFTTDLRDVDKKGIYM